MQGPENTLPYEIYGKVTLDRRCIDPLAFSAQRPSAARDDGRSADGATTVSLRLQLLAVGLLTLVLPWTGFRYVQEMEAALRAGLEQSLLARAATVADGARGAERARSARRRNATRSAPAPRSMRRRSRGSPSSTASATIIGTPTADRA